MSIFNTIFQKIFNRTQNQNAPVSPDVSRQAPTNVDINQVMSTYEKQSDQKLNWRNSIVDLLKLLNLDSSLEARKSLARELNYSGNMNDSAAMNIWLSKEVLKKLSENGGKVPQDLIRAS